MLLRPLPLFLSLRQLLRLRSVVVRKRPKGRITRGSALAVPSPAPVSFRVRALLSLVLHAPLPARAPHLYSPGLTNVNRLYAEEDACRRGRMTYCRELQKRSRLNRPAERCLLLRPPVRVCEIYSALRCNCGGREGGGADLDRCDRVRRALHTRSATAASFVWLFPLSPLSSI